MNYTDTVKDTLWRVRRHPKNHHLFQVFTFAASDTGELEVMPGHFDTIKSAQEFADTLNHMRKELKCLIS